jgi:uncharacterized membrane protein YqjE
MQSPPTHSPPPTNKAERSVGELLSDLAQDTSTLVRQEVSLATAEITQKVTQAAKALGLLMVGLTFAFLGLEMLVNSGVIFLADRLAGGKTPGPQHALLAFFIVFGVVTAISAALIIKGIKALKSNNLMPQQTVETLKEDIQWAKQQTQ